MWIRISRAGGNVDNGGFQPPWGAGDRKPSSRTGSLQRLSWIALFVLFAAAFSLCFAAADEERAASDTGLLGTWQLELATPDTPLTPSLKLEKRDGQIVGVYDSSFGKLDVTDIRVNGRELSFQVAGKRDGVQIHAAFAGKLDNGTIRGSLEFNLNGQTGKIAFSGRKQPPRHRKPPMPAPDVGGVIGRQIAEFTAKDFRGKTHTLSDYEDHRLVVVYFLGTECPLAKLYGPRMQKVLDQFADQGIAILGVSSNVQDSITELAAHARVHQLAFPVLKDLGQRIADQFGATRTPQVFVLDADRKIRYYGNIDAQYTFGAGVGLAQPQEQRADLVIALEELLAGQQVTIPVTEAKGCLIGRARTPRTDSPVTYSNQIAGLIQNRCLECHREGQIAPFAMTEYEEVAGWGEMIAEVVRQQRMPPWHANPAHGAFANENLLSADEKQLIYTWVANGCPPGDPADLPEPRKFGEGWFLPHAPHKVVYLERDEHVKAEGVENYRYIEVDPGIEEDKWVQLAECLPGNRAVVHHIIVYVKPPGSSGRGGDRTFLAGFAPGTRPLVAPDGWAKHVPAGSKFIFEVHYTPIGTPQTDRSGIGLVFMDEKDVTHRLVTTAAMQQRFAIPPYESDHEVTASRTFRRETIMLSLFPHMHMRGKSFRYELTYPDKTKEILLDVPRYDFNWQNSFIFAQPKSIPKGSVLHCTAIFDNSDENLHNPDPSKTVRWGDQTWQEMMIGWYDIGIPLH